jgi:hypothetical protein
MAQHAEPAAMGWKKKGNPLFGAVFQALLA